MRFLWSLVTLCVAALIPTSAANAMPVDPGPLDPNPNAAARVISLGPGGTLTGGGGYQAPVGYPVDQYPEPGYDPDALGFTSGQSAANPFAAVINVQPFTPLAAPVLQTYCLDIVNSTFTDVPYDPGTWDASNVSNLGYILRVLTDNFPVIPGQPSGISPVTSDPLTDDERAFIVQGAIWWFSDRVAAQPLGPYLSLVRQVVLAAIAAGPLPQPRADLRIAGPTTGVPGVVTGPYTLEGSPDGAPAQTMVTNGQLFGDAAGTTPLPNPATLAVGTQFFISTPVAGTVEITAQATVQSATGRVLLYAPADPDNPVPATAQLLIVAIAGSLLTEATLAVQFSPLPPGPSPLPVTGESNPAPIVGVGLTLIGLGVIAVVFSRRRHRAFADGKAKLGGEFDRW